MPEREVRALRERREVDRLRDRRARPHQREFRPQALVQGEIAAGANTGACCYNLWGNCIRTSESACVDGGGRFKGVGTECGELTCQGACCFGSSCFEPYGLGLCVADGGTYQGDGSRCTQLTIDCPPTTGACCVGDSCQDSTPADCDVAGGTFLGLGVPCWRVSCTPPEIHGACCFPDASCRETTRARCADAGGTHRGEGTICGGDICTGACCFSWGCSEDNAPFWCALDGGNFQGLGTRCDSVQCPLPECQTDADCPDDGLFCTGIELCDGAGSCYSTGDPCSPDGVCDDDLDECFVPCTADADCDDELFCNGSETCDTSSGVCVGGSDPCPDDGQFCNGFEFCEEANDACVPSGNPCDSLTELCDEATDTCVAQDTGACCVGAFGCWDNVSADYCNLEDGEFQGPGTVCDPWPCPPPGACCLGTDCMEVSAGQCKRGGGAYQGDDTRCSDANIACPTGACCFQDSTCQMLTADGCTSRDGSFLGAGRACDFGGFPFGGPIVLTPGEPPVGACPGACCAFASSACTDRIGRQLCEGPLQGVFQGDGSQCTENRIECPNVVGACCAGFGIFFLGGVPFGPGSANAVASFAPSSDLGAAIPTAVTRSPNGQVGLAAGITPEFCVDGITDFECDFSFLGLGEFHEGQTCSETQCPSALCPGIGECCTPHRAPGCNDEDCCRKVCGADPWCCIPLADLFVWNERCASLANRLCGRGKGHYCADRLADLDGNGLVDLRDYQLFQLQLCPPAACCLADGSCQEMCGEVCLARGGQYAGDRSTCADVVCNASP